MGNKSIYIVFVALFFFSSVVFAQDNYQKLGDQYYQQKKYDKAIENYKKAITHDPKNDSNYFTLGMLYGNSGDFKNARDYLKKAVSLNPNNYKALAFLAAAEAELGNYNQSIKYFEKVKIINPLLSDKVDNEILGIKQHIQKQESK